MNKYYKIMPFLGTIMAVLIYKFKLTNYSIGLIIFIMCIILASHALVNLIFNLTNK